MFFCFLFFYMKIDRTVVVWDLTTHEEGSNES